MAFDASRLRDLAISDAGFVFDPVTGRTFTVNEAGLKILLELKDGREPATLARTLAEVFDVREGEDVAGDVEDFLESLREQGLIA